MQTSTTLPHPSASGALARRLRTQWSVGLRCRSDTVFALGISALWALLYNLRFWQQALATMWQPGVRASLFVATLLVLVVVLQAVLLLLVPTRRLLKTAASLLSLVAALGAYFCDTYGTLMNKDMMRNALQTERAEIAGLLSPDLLVHLLLLGVLPALLIWRIQLPPRPWQVALRRRTGAVAAMLAVCVAALFACSADYAVFFRAHKPVRYLLMPAAPVFSIAGLLSTEWHAPARTAAAGTLLDPAGQVKRVAPAHARPLVVFLVIGETARAEEFQLGGYARATNPGLTALQGRTGAGELAYFDRASACGTSTAISVPCLFSPFPRGRFELESAARYTNLLDSLVKAGLQVEWRDNNAGCKGVCARVHSIEYGKRRDPALCPHSYCYDEVLLDGLAQRLENLRTDTLIVFHQIGSHGPAYSERYPAAFERFKPACRSNELQRCSAEEVRNAYDNTILYTDHVLAQQIALLNAVAERVDSVLIYVSDHGESLGERGIYLHGMPYTFAPSAQKEVPMLLWVSPGYLQRAHLRSGCLPQRAQARDPASSEGDYGHDNVYHTVLGAAEVRDQVYDARLDLLAPCRAPS